MAVVPFKKKAETNAGKMERLVGVVLDSALAADVPLQTRIDALKVLKAMVKLDDPDAGGMMAKMRDEISEASSGDE